MPQANRPALPAQLLWSVFLFFQLMIVGLLVLLWNSRFPYGTFEEAMRVDFTIFQNPAVSTLTVLALSQIALGIFVPNRMNRSKDSSESSPSFTAMIVRMVFFEACGLIGIVVNVIGTTFLVGLVCVVLEMAAMIVFRPKET